MNRLGIFGDLIRNAFFVLAQVLVFKNMVLFETAFCFFYIIIFLQVSVVTNPLVQLISAFFVGLIIDMFYNTMGMHAAASVLVVFVRIYWITLLTPRGGYDVGAKVNIRIQGIQWYLGYSYPLILLHCISLFYIESAGSTLFWSTLAKAFYSSLFTLSIVLIAQYSLYKKVK